VPGEAVLSAARVPVSVGAVADAFTILLAESCIRTDAATIPEMAIGLTLFMDLMLIGGF
jgi:hypothetical protein